MLKTHHNHIHDCTKAGTNRCVWDKQGKESHFVLDKDQLEAAMRTRSRMLSKRRLQLPTIKEGTEETIRDHVEPPSSDDYFLSICHLASPTFPSQAQDAAPDAIGARRMEARILSRWGEYKCGEWYGSCISLPYPIDAPEHGGSRSVTPEVHTREEEKEHVSHVQQGERKDLNAHHGNSDPLEYLYGHQRTPSASGTVRGCGDVRGSGPVPGRTAFLAPLPQTSSANVRAAALSYPPPLAGLPLTYSQSTLFPSQRPGQEDHETETQRRRVRVPR